MKNQNALFVTLLALILSLPLMAAAELPPQHYIEAAGRAPEALLVRVLDVKERGWGATTTVEVTAEAAQVRRTLSGLAPGSRLRIVYTITRHPPGWVGPSQPPALKKGMLVSAFLSAKPDEPGSYRIVAGGQSFSSSVWDGAMGPEPPPTNDRKSGP